MTETNKPASRAPCRSCRHYFITWDPNSPHGCRAFGFKSAMLPCLDVQSASDLQCLKYQLKEKKVP